MDQEMNERYVLNLNHMRSARVENLSPVCWSENPEDFRDLIKREQVEYYRDENWGKNFRKGGPLEWFNPPFGRNWFQRTEKSLEGIPHVSELK